MSIQVVIDSSGTSIFAMNASNSASCSGVASSGGDQKLGLPCSSMPLAHRRPDRCRDGLLVELGRRPRREAAVLDRRAGPAMLRGELLRVPGRIAGPRERPDRDVVGPDVVGMAVAAEARCRS